MGGSCPLQPLTSVCATISPTADAAHPLSRKNTRTCLAASVSVCGGGIGGAGLPQGVSPSLAHQARRVEPGLRMAPAHQRHARPGNKGGGECGPWPWRSCFVFVASRDIATAAAAAVCFEIPPALLRGIGVKAGVVRAFSAGASEDSEAFPPFCCNGGSRLSLQYTVIASSIGKWVSGRRES